MIPAFRRLLEQYPDAYLVLAYATGAYHDALQMLPPDAISELATIHNALGAIYGEALPAYEAARKPIVE